MSFVTMPIAESVAISSPRLGEWAGQRLRSSGIRTRRRTSTSSEGERAGERIRRRVARAERIEIPAELDEPQDRRRVVTRVIDVALLREGRHHDRWHAGTRA